MINYEQEIDKYLKRLFPITRSITGDGNRETLLAEKLFKVIQKNHE